MKKIALVVCVSILLSGCDDDSSSSSSDTNVSESQISSLIEQSNYEPSYVSLYDADTSLAYNQIGTVRFDTTSQIPLYYVSSDGSPAPQSIVDAYANLEARLGNIFTDITVITADLSGYRDNSYPTENRGNFTFDAATFNAAHGITGGLVISEGTAYYSSEYADNPQNMCANASSAPYDGGLSINIEPNTNLYTSDTVLWVNMGNGQCSWGYEMVMHETAHNMGMFEHVEPYFGLWSDTAMNMLATIYTNAGGTAYADLVINYQ